MSGHTLEPAVQMCIWSECENQHQRHNRQLGDKQHSAGLKEHDKTVRGHDGAYDSLAALVLLGLI